MRTISKQVLIALIFSLFLLLPLITASISEPNENFAGGYIHVKCGPNVDVFLDGKFFGKTNQKDNGLIMRNIPRGDHIVTLKGLGINPIEKHVTVIENDIAIVIVNMTKYNGGIRLFTIPKDVIIDIPAISISNFTKNSKYWCKDNISEGQYSAKIKYNTYKKDIEFSVKMASWTNIFIDLPLDSISVKTSPFGDMSGKWIMYVKRKLGEGSTYCDIYRQNNQLILKVEDDKYPYNGHFVSEDRIIFRLISKTGGKIDGSETWYETEEMSLQVTNYEMLMKGNYSSRNNSPNNPSSASASITLERITFTNDNK